MRQFSFDQLQTRQLALTVGCRYCHAPAGERCTVPGRLRTDPKPLLENFPAHHCRIERAQRQRRLNTETESRPTE